jgi:hypothetical protein
MSRLDDFQLEAGSLPREGREVCGVMVLYEDLPARALAIQLHDRLIPRFKGEIEFGFNWWRFDYLADPEIAREAASCALRADLILVALHQLADVSLTVKSWFETWLWKRPAGEGALAVVRVSPVAGEPILHDDAFLRLAAKRAHLDYLTLTGPPSAPQVSDRLRGVVVIPAATILEESPNPQYQSSHWGLNE